MEKRGYSAIGLVNPKNEMNVGGVMRAAHCFGSKMVVTQGHRVRYSADTPKFFQNNPVFRSVRDVFDYIPYDCIPVAVDLVEGAVSLPMFEHPQRAFYIFGPEDGTLNSHVLKRSKHRVFVPTNNCLNLAATVNVVLYDRTMKQMKDQATKQVVV